MPRISCTTMNTPLGEVYLGAVEGIEPTEHAPAGTGLCLTEFTNPDRLMRERAQLELALGASFPEAGSTGGADADRVLAEAEHQLGAYFAGDLTSFDLPLVMPGTPFQQSVWQALLELGHAETTTYGELAGALGNPDAQRAVGAANGANRIAIIVPCHRVVDASGGLHGYAGGLERKRWLLDHEAGDRGTLFEGMGVRSA